MVRYNRSKVATRVKGCSQLCFADKRWPDGGRGGGGGGGGQMCIADKRWAYERSRYYR